MNSIIRSIQRLSLTPASTPQLTTLRFRHVPFIKPAPGVKGKSYRRIVHFPESYTVQPLNVTNLAGRDPVSGRIVCKGIGGGIKHKYHWIDWKRTGPGEGPPQAERVIKIIVDGCRTAHIALVAYGNRVKYILATENMKAGDIIHTSCHIPRIPVRANEGDAHPLGALPLGTQVNCVEPYPGFGGALVHAAGAFATILRRAPDQRVIVAMPSRKEFSLPETCMCTVGRLSNVAHAATPVGSAQRMRELGNRPRSGLWQRKTGRHGRKVRPPPPVKQMRAVEREAVEVVRLSWDGKFTRTNNHQFHY